MSALEKRGLTYAEAIAYVGVKRATFDAEWRPQLVAMRQGVVLIFDRLDLDRLFDDFKRAAAGEPGDRPAANDDAQPPAHNARRNERPIAAKKGASRWVNPPGASTPTKTAGRSTSTGVALDFDSAVSEVLKRPSPG